MRSLVFTLLIFSFVSVEAQSKVLRNMEFSSARNVRFSNSNTPGFGVGATYYQGLKGRVKFIAGIEYNRLESDYDKITTSKLSHKTNVNYQFDGFGIPMGLRYYLDNNYSFFLESVLLPEMVFIKESGTNEYFPENRSTKIYEKYTRSAAYISLAAGAQVLFSKFYLGLKPEVRFGTGLIEGDYGDGLKPNAYYRLGIIIGFAPF